MGHTDSESIDEKIGDTGDYLVISVQKTEKPLEDDNLEQTGIVRTNEHEHWIFQIDAAKPLILRPFNAAASVTAYKKQAGISPVVPYLEPDEGTVEVPLVDENGNDVLRNDEDDWFVYHVAVSPLQENLRVYPFVPESQPDGVFQYLSNNRPAPTQGDVVGYVDGNDTEDFYDPDGGLNEVLAWNEGSNTDLSFGLYNNDQERRIIPKLSIDGAGYSLSPILGEAEKRKVLFKAFNDDQNVVHFQWGALRDSFTYEVPDEWTNADNVIESLGAFNPEEVLDGEFEGEMGGDL